MMDDPDISDGSEDVESLLQHPVANRRDASLGCGIETTVELT
jgi:hypothetical protein